MLSWTCRFPTFSNIIGHLILRQFFHYMSDLFSLLNFSVGSRYVSWLPSFSVEVTHTQILGDNMQAQQMPGTNSQYDNSVRIYFK